jgi:hypothetical protein
MDVWHPAPCEMLHIQHRSKTQQMLDSIELDGGEDHVSPPPYPQFSRLVEPGTCMQGKRLHAHALFQST